MERPSILLADDHRIVAEGLASILKSSYDLVGVATDGQQLVEAARKHRPDAIVADMSMPVMDGLGALRQLKAEGIETKVVFLTMHRDPALAAQALRAGASGYLLKQSAGEELVLALRKALGGGVYLSPQISTEALAALSGAPSPEDTLTNRQRDVLRLVVEGKSMKEVAAALKLSRRTVETHKYEMMQTLGVQTTAELIRFAFQRGLVPC
jgi:DNA-binding NarL/FixJ family response regulator